MPDRLVADDVGGLVRVRIDVEVDEPALGPALHLRLQRGATDEVVVELEVALHPRLERCVDRAELTEPRAEALLHAQRHQRPETEQGHAVRLAGVPQHVEQRPLVLGRDPDLVPEVARVRHPPDPRRDHPDVDVAERHEREVGRRQRRRRHRLQHVAGARPGDGQPDERQGEHLEADRRR